MRRNHLSLPSSSGISFPWCTSLGTDKEWKRREGNPPWKTSCGKSPWKPPAAGAPRQRHESLDETMVLGLVSPSPLLASVVTVLGGATSGTLPFPSSSPNSLIKPFLSQGWGGYLARAKQGEASRACILTLSTGSRLAGGIGNPCSTPADSQHFPLLCQMTQTTRTRRGRRN